MYLRMATPWAQGTGNAPALVELHELLVKGRGRLEREHRRLSTGDQDRVEAVGIDICDRDRVLDQCNAGWCGDEPHRDEIKSPSIHLDLGDR